MTRSLIILTLLFHNCGSGSSSIETKQEIISDTTSKQPQTVVAAQQETADSNFLTFWKKFTDVAKANNQKAFVTMAFDSLQFEGKSIHINTFMRSYFPKIFDDSLIAALSDRNKLDFISADIDASYLPGSTMKQVKAGKCIEKTVNITTVNKYPSVIIMFKFIETKNGYKLSGYDRIG